MTAGQSPTRLVRALRNGQITIPVEFRRQLGLTEQSLLQMTLVDGELRIRPVQVSQTAAGSPWFKELYDLFAPVREEILAAGISEEEVNADIDAAIAEVRAKHAQRRL